MKKPKAKFSPSTNKSPKAAISPSSFLKDRPSWRVRSMEFSDPFGWHIINGSKIIDIQSRLASFETMIWSEIIGPNNHSISKKDICVEAQKWLVQINQDDIDELFSLRLAGKERIFGILEGNVLRILWWDPSHQIYPSPKKHT